VTLIDSSDINTDNETSLALALQATSQGKIQNADDNRIRPL